MVDVQSNNDERPQTQQAGRAAESDFKLYLEQNPDMANQVFKVLLSLYQDPAKESEAKA